MTPDDWSTSLLTGIAELLAAAGVGVWRPDGTAYGADDVAIVVMAVPPEPDRVITVSLYGPITSDGGGDITVGLQARIRGTTDPREALRIGDRVAAVLDGYESDINGVPVSQIFQRPGAVLGQDSSDRHELSSNFYIQARRETALRQ